MKLKIHTDYITLGQLLKKGDLIQSGGEAKGYLNTVEVLVNGEKDQRRGRKIRPGDVVETNGVRIEVE
ncbi:S4 domain-containing protein YaaA [uncultured Dubosiella sp.]|uniref:S4 domain-containing protein YaaA n=1 Tax=uncultured Dubosiella sp. TaxID=1937011 RepID=UPI0027312293|nr:S4 domain-containing protein YaaA [uncultured Dubosiella sp.]